jgi:ubiquitin-like 1-activating enzyme E1 B
MSKAQVAKTSANRFNPKVDITAHLGNITDTEKFGVEFFRQFDVVMNGLDNLHARRHVNIMCLTVNIPLIETGTAGYLGQTKLIRPGISECYDCIPLEPPKTFPVCTIRSTPSAPIHCVVWAKSFLLNQLFHAAEDTPVDTKDVDETKLKAMEEENSSMKSLLESRKDDDFAEKVFRKVMD